MKGTGRAAFVAILLLTLGALNIIYGFAAIGNALHGLVSYGADDRGVIRAY